MENQDNTNDDMHISNDEPKNDNQQFDKKDKLIQKLKAENQELNTKNREQAEQIKELSNILIQLQHDFNQLSISLDNSKMLHFEGIINSYRNSSKAGVYEEILIESSSIYMDDPKYSPRNAIIYEDQTKFFSTQNQKKSWISFNFQNYHAYIHHYSIRSYNGPRNSIHPKTWMLEGSNDKIHWVTLDKQKDCDYLNGKNLSHAFPIMSENNQAYQIIRLCQTDFNCANSDFLCFKSIEFYGVCEQIQI